MLPQALFKRPGVPPGSANNDKVDVYVVGPKTFESLDRDRIAFARLDCADAEKKWALRRDFDCGCGWFSGGFSR